MPFYLPGAFLWPTPAKSFPTHDAIPDFWKEVRMSQLTPGSDVTFNLDSQQCRILNPGNENTITTEDLIGIINIPLMEPDPNNWQSYIIKITDNIPPPHCLIGIQGKILASNANIMVLGGKAKAGKTFIASDIVAAWLGKSKLGFAANPLPGKESVLVIDNEQARCTVANVLKRIYKIAELPQSYDDPRITLLSFPPDLSAAEQSILITNALSELGNIGLLVIDGLIDMCPDFMDAKISQDFAKALLALARKENILIIGMLHENKQTSDLRGHFGSFVTQKAQAVIQVLKEHKQFKIVGTFLREEPFEDFYFSIIEGLPELAQNLGKTESAQDRNLRDWLSNINYVLPVGKSLSYTELTKELAEITGLAEPTIKKKVGDALKLNFLVKGADGNYRKCINSIVNGT